MWSEVWGVDAASRPTHTYDLLLHQEMQAGGTDLTDRTPRLGWSSVRATAEPLGAAAEPLPLNSSGCVPVGSLVLSWWFPGSYRQSSISRHRLKHGGFHGQQPISRPRVDADERLVPDRNLSSQRAEAIRTCSREIRSAHTTTGMVLNRGSG